MAHLRRLVLERLLRYHRYLVHVRDRVASRMVTSGEIARALDIDPTQVRKDLGAVGTRGVGRVGFDSVEVVNAIAETLGLHQEKRAIIVGAGHLGTALLAYEGFREYGLNIVAIFDSDRRKVGTDLLGYSVRDTRGLRGFIVREQIRLAILTVPLDVAQTVTDRLVGAGIDAIWNFAPRRLLVPPGVFVRNEHISLGLSQLAYHLRG